MQISAQNLLASQQTAQVQTRPAPGFTTALESDGFAPLPLKQTAPAENNSAAAPPSPNRFARPGALVDIKI